MVYIETSVISYLAARKPRDVVAAGQQVLTRDWWTARRGEFDCVISEIVIQEIEVGDVVAARRRVEVARSLRTIPVRNEARSLARRLLEACGLPAKAALDALHIAVAAINAADYLLTWNCRHLANAALRPRIESACAKAGWSAPLICTPSELMEDPGATRPNR